MMNPPDRIRFRNFDQQFQAYIKQGTLVDEAVWRRAENVFGGNLIGFTVWFN